jgi:minimal PKS acyl carrier protein
MSQQWTANDLLDYLVEQSVLPPDERPAHITVTFDEAGLDSLAYLHLQSSVYDSFGAELPAEFPPDYTLAEVLSTVNLSLAQREVA